MDCRVSFWRIGGKGKEREREMSSSAVELEAPDLLCQLDNVQGMVEALSAVRWKRHQVCLSFPHFRKIMAFRYLGFWGILIHYFVGIITGRSSGIIWARRRSDRGGYWLSSSQSLSSTWGTHFLLLLFLFLRVNLFLVGLVSRLSFLSICSYLFAMNIKPKGDRGLAWAWGSLSTVWTHFLCLDVQVWLRFNTQDLICSFLSSM